ncbi:MAG: hypothetical protein J6L24_04490 [Oscillospiraceae bacterium]|nr:hypothetical protein [Oscillospiraceae bacterium]
MKRIGLWIRNFMAGRYGVDKLSTVILWVAVAVMLISLFIPVASVKLILMVVYNALMFWAIFRSLSRNTYKRYQENRRFLLTLERIRDRKHRYFTCPKCRQPVRVPRGKGKIAITCPRCKERFIRKT